MANPIPTANPGAEIFLSKSPPWFQFKTGYSPANLGADISLSKNPPWFQSKIGYNLTPAGRQLLEEYSGISASEVEAHIYRIVSVLTIDNINLANFK